ncbi:substrate-binding domain-containing protein [Gordonia sp. ABSL1-1]|uniref:substrate-binding domain-containing protein n=1 Tax=Gordonia sp. ABSL1-1 TaxID=3053923 RepID=UPI0025734C68|nr:substrate-binding domain-containing protein [Gordonia sp. ABSL1-1]MDL9938334.1 substrate-binding domain-containing protein [Gordonia sp. ABSL1-1]
MTTDDEQPRFRLAYVPGTTPGKWARRWTQRHPGIRLELHACEVPDAIRLIADGDVDAALTRLVASDGGSALNTVELYTEDTVVIAGVDHYLTAAAQLTVADLADEQLLQPLDAVLAWEGLPGTMIEHRPETTADAVELVAAGVGVLVVPQSLARLHHRKDLAHRVVTDAPASIVALCWPAPTDDVTEDFVGIVRGRGVNSSRGGTEEHRKRSAKEKTAAKRAAREAAGKVPGRNFGKSAARRRGSR